MVIFSRVPSHSSSAAIRANHPPHLLTSTLIFQQGEKNFLFSKLRKTNSTFQKKTIQNRSILEFKLSLASKLHVIVICRSPLYLVWVTIEFLQRRTGQKRKNRHQSESLVFRIRETQNQFILDSESRRSRLRSPRTTMTLRCVVASAWRVSRRASRCPVGRWPRWSDAWRGDSASERPLRNTAVSSRTLANRTFPPFVI